jgi:uncharacterized protein YcbK (DUF882 family)
VIFLEKINDFQISENFNLQEFECTHQNHRHVQVDLELITKLEKLRKRLGLPMIVNSGYRCPKRNQQVGGAEKSQHLLGKAADISLHNQQLDIDIIFNIARKIGFKGIGLYDNFIHLDVRDGNFATWNNRK